MVEKIIKKIRNSKLPVGEKNRLIKNIEKKLSERRIMILGQHTRQTNKLKKEYEKKRKIILDNTESEIAKIVKEQNKIFKKKLKEMM